MTRAGTPERPKTAGSVATTVGVRRVTPFVNWYGRGGGTYDPPMDPAKAEAVRDFNQLVDRTNRLYAKCMARGGHLDSGDTIERDVSGKGRVAFTVCRRCGVPYR